MSVQSVTAGVSVGENCLDLVGDPEVREGGKRGPELDSLGFCLWRAQVLSLSLSRLRHGCNDASEEGRH